MSQINCLFTVLFLRYIILPPTIADELTEVPMDVDRASDSGFLRKALDILWYERDQMGHTPLFKVNVPGSTNLELFFKNEAASRTGNLKHRFSWALFLWALLEGHISRYTTIYEASSGNTATSEAYFAQKIGVSFVAVIPVTTDQAKIDAIEHFGGKVIKVEKDTVAKASAEAEKNNGFFMNQFANADRAKEFHTGGEKAMESTNVLHEIMHQLSQLDGRPKQPKDPDFVVHSAGTGGTISSIGRYAKKYRLNTKIVLADSQFSAFYDHVIHNKFGDSRVAHKFGPGMAGTGTDGPVKLGNTTSLVASVIDRAIKLPDLASTAAMHVLQAIGIEAGTSSGMNFLATLSLSAKYRRANPGRQLRVVAILADSSSLYSGTYFNKTWIDDKFKMLGGLQIFNCWKKVIERSYRTGTEPLEDGKYRCQFKNSHTLIEQSWTKQIFETPYNEEK